MSILDRFGTGHRGVEFPQCPVQGVATFLQMSSSLPALQGWRWEGTKRNGGRVNSNQDILYEKKCFLYVFV